MRKIPEDMKPGTVHENKFGRLVIVDYEGSKKISVKFINTGYERFSTSGNIRKGIVKDLFLPSLFGVGFLGGEKHKSHINGVMTKSYSHWSGMMERCYSLASKKRYPTYEGCEVHPDWHNFQTFADWYDLETKINPNCNYLDKDIKVNGNKIYGPDTCIMTTNQKNTEKALAKNWVFKSPYGVIVNIYNLRKFCRENGLHHGSMQYVHSGKNSHHKGWTKP